MKRHNRERNNPFLDGFPGLDRDPGELISFRLLVNGVATMPDEVSCLILDTALLHVGDTAVDHITIDNAGIKILDGTTLRGQWHTDGDIFIGSDLSGAATTYLSIFADAQAYNGESMEGGDMLIGDNSTSKANILWDKSAGQLKFRGGTTTHSYIDTSGALTAGSGNVVLNNSGITVLNYAGSTPGADNAIGFRNGSGTVTAGLYGSDEAGVNRVHLLVNNETSHTAYMLLEADGASSQQGIIDITAKATGANSNSIMLTAGGFGPGILIYSLGDGLNIDTMYCILPRITTAERNALSAVDGMIIYNTTTNAVEARENGTWVNL